MSVYKCMSQYFLCFALTERVSHRPKQKRKQKPNKIKHTRLKIPQGKGSLALRHSCHLLISPAAFATWWWCFQSTYHKRKGSDTYFSLSLFKAAFRLRPRGDIPSANPPSTDLECLLILLLSRVSPRL